MVAVPESGPGKYASFPLVRRRLGATWTLATLGAGFIGWMARRKRSSFTEPASRRGGRRHAIRWFRLRRAGTALAIGNVGTRGGDATGGRVAYPNRPHPASVSLAHCGAD